MHSTISGLNIIAVVALIVTLASCISGNSDKEVTPPIEQMENPADWSRTSKVSLRSDTTRAWPTWTASEGGGSIGTNTMPFEELLSQLWKLAFSGDAQVYEPSILGEVDLAKPLDPNLLVDFLSSSDTIFSENLETGALEEQVISSNFEEGDVSAILLNLMFMQDESNEMVAYVNSVGLGSRVFDPDGFYRGVKVKYFIDLDAPESGDLGASYRLNIETDSTGLFRMSNLQAMTESTPNLMQLLNSGAEAETISKGFDFRLDYQNRLLYAVIKRNDPV